jgi:hypothetical protein
MLSSRALLAVLLVAIHSFPVQSAALAGLPARHDSDADQLDAGFALDLTVPTGALQSLAASLKKLGIQAIGASPVPNPTSPPNNIASGPPQFASAPTQITSAPPQITSAPVHILVGPFNSSEDAATYGDLLVARGLIVEFSVRRPGRHAGVTVLGAINPQNPLKFAYDTKVNTSGHLPGPTETRVTGEPPVAATGEPPAGAAGGLRTAISRFDPAADRPIIPDPVKMALRDIAGIKAERSGGLWLAGDIREGVTRLQWIAGQSNADVLQVAPDGKVTFSSGALMHASRADRAGAGANLVLIDYLKSNEGLYLLAQLLGAEYRYCLYLGQHVPTAGDGVEIDGAINLDNNFDSRINTYRKEGLKLPNECPPAGFDSMIGINPGARWFNLRVKQIVPDGIIVFHELAEALAKVDFGLDYLPDGMKAGAHDTAVQRELKLQSERPGPETVVTLGSNVVFKTTEDFLKFRSDRETTKTRRR